MSNYFTYILRCSDGSYYVGHTDDLAQRVAWHNQGHGSTWTAKRRPVTLIYSEPHATETEAVRREKQIKRWSRAKKDALIAGDLAALKQHSKRRN
ncbi:MAG: GIY-YIG nuclease family protein [Planctomycetes bacterium]|nr:GIY-YIG nuclease family protein [Planctomycetota bacterium]